MAGGEEEESVRFSISDIAFGEALIGVSAHLDNALEMYRRGDAAAALVHANRSLEQMPRISSELWRFTELATVLNQAVGAVSSAIRARHPVPHVAETLETYDRLSARAVGAVVGEGASSPAYRASVVVALMRTATAAHEAGVGDDARALVLRARSLAAMLWGGAISPDEVDRAFERLVSSPDDVRSSVAAIATALHDSFGAVLNLEPEPRELLDRVLGLLEGAREAARAGDSFRADKLVGQAYVEVYTPLRETLQGWTSEAELSELIGTRIRRALAAGEPVDDLLYRARRLLEAAPL
ncbi:MAG: hypothetical protein ACRDQ2_07065 [Gaiellales bacterium]